MKRFSNQSIALFSASAALLCLVVLGLVHSINNHTALDRLEKLGGQNQYRSEHFPVVAWLPPSIIQETKGIVSPTLNRIFGHESWAGRIKKIVGIDYRGTQLQDRDLSSISRLRNLQWLWLSDTEITDDGLAHLKGVALDQFINLDGTQISGSGLKHLVHHNTRYLDLSRSEISEAGIPHLLQMKHLESLNVIDTKLSEAAVEKLRTGLPDCSIWF